MFDVNKAIYACDDVICRNIESFTTEQRGLLSQNILSQLRNFVENIFVKVYISLGGEPQRKDYDTIRVACSYVKALQGEYRFLSQFHKLLQISVSHYTLDPDSSERLMLKYYEYLLRIRILMKEKFGMQKQTVHTVVSALQKKGYLLLEASEGDKREKRIVLTESGQVYAHRMIAPLRKAEEKVYRTIGNERLQAMCEILDLFNLLFERELRGGLGSE